MSTRLGLAFTMMFLAACSGAGSSSTSNGDGAQDGDPSADPSAQQDNPSTKPDGSAPKQTAWAPTFPTVRNRGGKVIANPRVLPIVFPGDANAQGIDDFTHRLAGSQYWSTMTKEYGVGAITAEDTVQVDSAAPASVTSTEIEQWLAQAIQNPDPSTLYAVYFPAGTSVSLELGGQSSQSCQQFAGYHSEVTVNGVKVGYAALPVCTTFDDLTVTASHEYLEWATDPFPLTAPAFTGGDDAHWAFGQVVGAEVGDRCNGYLDQSTLLSQELGYQVQRGWSNKLSLAGKYPCAPAKTGPYIQAIADATDDVSLQDSALDGSTRTVKTKAIRVAPGKTRTVDVHIWSDTPGAHKVQLAAKSYADLNGTQPSGFGYTLDPMGTTGGVAKLVIEAPTKGTDDILTIVAFVDKSTYYVWPVLVTSSDGATASAPGSISRRPTFATPMRRSILSVQ